MLLNIFYRIFSKISIFKMNICPFMDFYYNSGCYHEASEIDEAGDFGL